MAIKIQYNKTALQQIDKQLKIRIKALPTIKSKESALRAEVKKAKDHVDFLTEQLSTLMQKHEGIISLWSEFQGDIITIEAVEFQKKKIAGVNTPILEDVTFQLKEFSMFNSPAWFFEGVLILKELAKISIEKDFFNMKMQILYNARKKTTQKVNLYEKVQIPEFAEGIRKIKRFLEDEENLSKSAQKIVKDKLQKMEAEQ